MAHARNIIELLHFDLREINIFLAKYPVYAPTKAGTRASKEPKLCASMMLNKGTQIPTANAIIHVFCGVMSPQIKAVIKINPTDIPVSFQCGLVSMKAIDMPKRIANISAVKNRGFTRYVSV